MHLRLVTLLTLAVLMAGGALAQVEPPMQEVVFASNAHLYYPERAGAQGVSGGVILQCAAGPGGVLDQCEVVAEKPLEMDFRPAALKMAEKRIITVPTAVEGEVIRVIVRFVARRAYLQPGVNAVVDRR